MRYLVTGAAGFIGSHLTDQLLRDGSTVLAIDSFTDAYDPDVKLANLREIDAPGLTFFEGDLRSENLTPLCAEVDAVLHLAALPGVRSSWSEGFDEYVTNNVLATQRILEAAKAAAVPRVVYASSSSVYGNATQYPCSEDHPTRPRSPYGVSKLAGEQLCDVYATVHGLSTVSLRYFTVYGPRQRPDMAVHRLCETALGRGGFTLYGDGSQVRDLTYVSDAVNATCLAAHADVAPGSIFNVAGGSEVSMSDLIRELDLMNGSRIPVDFGPCQPGDVDRTGGATDRALAQLGWEPTVSLLDGLAAQLAWHRSRDPVDITTA